MKFDIDLKGVAELNKKIENKKIEIETVIKKIIIEVFARIILKTPVRSGQARLNWQTTINQKAKSVITEGDTTGQKAINEMTRIVLSNKDMQKAVFWLSNNLDYIDVLEYGKYPNPPKKPTGQSIAGYSKRAPNGMVRTTLEEAQGIINKYKL